MAQSPPILSFEELRSVLGESDLTVNASKSPPDWNEFRKKGVLIRETLMPA
jgi:hypothetical protein